MQRHQNLIVKSLFFIPLLTITIDHYAYHAWIEDQKYTITSYLINSDTALQNTSRLPHTSEEE